MFFDELCGELAVREQVTTIQSHEIEFKIVFEFRGGSRLVAGQNVAHYKNKQKTKKQERRRKGDDTSMRAKTNTRRQLVACQHDNNEATAFGMMLHFYVIPTAAYLARTSRGRDRIGRVEDAACCRRFTSHIHTYDVYMELSIE